MTKYTITDFESLGNVLDEAKLYLTKAGLDEKCLFHSKLVFSELASNIAKHTPLGGEIKIEIKAENVEITLMGKASETMPKESHCSSVYAESGRGLFLIDSVCSNREDTEEGVKITLIREK